MDKILLTNVVGYAAAMIGAYMFVPQVIQIWKTKQTKGVSLFSFSLLTIVSVLWFVYGVLTNALPVILVNCVIGCLSLYVVLMKLRYK